MPIYLVKFNILNYQFLMAKKKVDSEKSEIKISD